MNRRLICFLSIAVATAIAQVNPGQTLPATEGETLIGNRVILSQSAIGHSTVLVMGFSRDAGDPCTDWARAVRSDPALAGVRVWESAMLAGAPGFIRGVIKSGMRKGFSAAEQGDFVVLVKDEALWRSYFGVSDEKEPYVVLLDANGVARWRGHGLARDFEGQLKEAFKGVQATGQR